MENSFNKNSKTLKNKKSKKKRAKRERGMIPYITTPLIFTLISLIIVLPLLFSFLNFAVKTVHNAQQVLSIDFNDKTVDSTRFDNKTLEYDNDKIGVCEKVGVLKCESAGISSDVYYGINRVSMRNGIGLGNESIFSGYKSKLNLAGYSTAALKGLNNVKVGDIIVLETTERVFEYQVVENSVTVSPSNNYSSGVIISCDENSKAFSAFSNEKRYVVGAFKSVRDKKGE